MERKSGKRKLGRPSPPLSIRRELHGRETQTHITPRGATRLGGRMPGGFSVEQVRDDVHPPQINTNGQEFHLTAVGKDVVVESLQEGGTMYVIPGVQVDGVDVTHDKTKIILPSTTGPVEIKRDDGSVFLQQVGATVERDLITIEGQAGRPKLVDSIDSQNLIGQPLVIVTGQATVEVRGDVSFLPPIEEDNNIHTVSKVDTETAPGTYRIENSEIKQIAAEPVDPIKMQKIKVGVAAGVSAAAVFGGMVAISQTGSSEQARPADPVVINAKPTPTTLFESGRIIVPSASPSIKPIPSPEVPGGSGGTVVSPETTQQNVITITRPMTKKEQTQFKWDSTRESIEQAFKDTSLKERVKNNDVALVTMLNLIGDQSQMLDSKSILILKQAATTHPELAKKIAIVLGNNRAGSLVEEVAKEKEALLLEIKADVKTIREQEANAGKKVSIDKRSKVFKAGQAAIRALAADLTKRRAQSFA